MIEVLQRGMANYWLLEYKRLKENYKLVEHLFNKYKKDNEVLTRLEQENEDLKKILGSRREPKIQNTESSEQQKTEVSI